MSHANDRTPPAATGRAARLWLFLALATLAAGLVAWRLGLPWLLGRLGPERLTATLRQTLELRTLSLLYTGVLGTLAAAIWLRRRPAFFLPPARWALLLAGLALALRWTSPDMAFNSIVRPDGVHFSAVAQGLVAGAGLSVPTGTTRLPARTLPGQSLVQAATQWLAPAHPGAGIFAVWLCAVLTAVAAWRFGNRLFGAGAGAVAALLILLSPLHGWYSRQLMSEIPWGLLTLVACGWAALSPRRPAALLGAGFLMGLGLLFKSSHLLMIIGFAAALLGALPGGRMGGIGRLTALTGLAAGMLPALLYNRCILGGWWRTAYHVYWPGWASPGEALGWRYLWQPPLINGSMGNLPYYLLTLLGLDPRPERMILPPLAAAGLAWWWWRIRRTPGATPPAAAPADAARRLFMRAVVIIGALYGLACLLYSFQEPRFLLPIIPLVCTGLGGSLAMRGPPSATPGGARPPAGAALATACLLGGLGLAIIQVEWPGRRIPERQVLERLRRATDAYDVLVSDEDPVLLTQAGVWNARLRLLPLLRPGELWFPEEPARLFAAQGIAVTPFTGTITRVHAALAEGARVAVYIRRPRARPQAYAEFNAAFRTRALAATGVPGLREITAAATVMDSAPAAPNPTPENNAPATLTPTAQTDAPIASVPATNFVIFTNGVFTRGADGGPEAVGRNRSLPVHPVTLSAFALARHETTQAEFAAFLNAAWGAGLARAVSNDAMVDVVWVAGPTTVTVCVANAPEPGLRFDPRVDDAPFAPGVWQGTSLARHPVTRVTWHGAALYANWRSRAAGGTVAYAWRDGRLEPVAAGGAGYRLPREAEWERASAGSDGRAHRYAFGDNWDPARANVAEAPRGERAPDAPLTVPADAPAPWSPADASDAAQPLHLTGNVWEWCEDWYGDYEAAPARDPRGPAVGTDKLVRGGSYRTRAEAAWCAFRGLATPDTQAPDIGFRLVRTPIP